MADLRAPKVGRFFGVSAVRRVFDRTDVCGDVDGSKTNQASGFVLGYTLIPRIGGTMNA